MVKCAESAETTGLVHERPLAPASFHQDLSGFVQYVACGGHVFLLGWCRPSRATLWVAPACRTGIRLRARVGDGRELSGRPADVHVEPAVRARAVGDLEPRLLERSAKPLAAGAFLEQRPAAGV